MYEHQIQRTQFSRTVARAITLTTHPRLPSHSSVILPLILSLPSQTVLPLWVAPLSACDVLRVGQVLDWDHPAVHATTTASSETVDRALEQRHALLRLLCADATDETEGVCTGSRRFFAVFQHVLGSEDKHAPSHGVDGDSASQSALLCKVRCL